MKLIVKSTLMPFALALFCVSRVMASTPLSIELSNENTTLNFDSAQHLDVILEALQTNKLQASKDSFPFYYRLFNVNKQPQIEAKRKNILSVLEQYMLQGNYSSQTLELFTQQVKRWSLSYRELISLDWDQVRIDTQMNPVLSGEFIFQRLPIPQNIEVYGALFKPRSLPFSKQLTLPEYLERTELLSSANPSYVWVIYPDGVIKRVGYAYWNYTEIPIPPGTTLFVGLNGESDEQIQLEKQISELIVHRR